MTTALEVLSLRYPSELAAKTVSTFADIERNFARRNWRECELDAGHFVENVRRILEFELKGGAYTPFTSSLPKFNDTAMREYENAQGSESYRLLIPRVLKPVYDIRNKRGVGHAAGVSPNHIDAMFTLYSAKWVLAELVRLSSDFPTSVIQTLCDHISERQLEILWKEGDSVRVLSPKMVPSDQVLVLLYDASPRRDEQLREAIEYADRANFKKVLKRLHKNREIEYRADGCCILLSPGANKAEDIIRMSTEGAASEVARPTGNKRGRRRAVAA